jgi:hypothetical protein
MRIRLLWAGILLAFAAVIATAPVNAQQPGLCLNGNLPYIVQYGDTVWDKMGGPGWEGGWAKLVRQNRTLADRPIIHRSADDVFVLLREGEELCGLETSGLEIRNKDVVANGVNWSEVAEADIPEIAVEADPRLDALQEKWSASTTQGESDWFDPPWWWWILIVVLAVWFLRWLWRFTHPTTSGPALTTHPLHREEPRRIARYTDTLASARFGPLATAEFPDRPRRVGDIETGLVTGIAPVRYSDKPRTRLMSREPGFRAWFEWPGGRREHLVFLAACGNDIIYEGVRYFGLTFEPTGTLGVVPEIPPPPPQTWGLELYLRYRNRLKAERVPFTRVRLWGHIINLEDYGWRITVLEELYAEVRRFIEDAEAHEQGADREKTTALGLREQAERLIERAAWHDREALRFTEASQDVRTQAAKLQPDIEMFLAPPPRRRQKPAESTDGDASAPEAPSQ